jgi:hypothetical protein
MKKGSERVFKVDPSMAVNKEVFVQKGSTYSRINPVSNKTEGTYRRNVDGTYEHTAATKRLMKQNDKAIKGK